MTHKYQIISREIWSFLVFVLMLLAVVTVATAIGTAFGVDGDDVKAQTTGFPADKVQVPAHAQEQIDEYVPTISTQDSTETYLLSVGFTLA